MSVHDLRIVVTGGSGGIGGALAQELGRRGARLALVGRNSIRLGATIQDVNALGAEAHAITADLTGECGVSHTRDAASAALGGIDVLVNCAGINAFEPFDASDPADIERAFRVNVIAPMDLTHAVLPEMLARGAGQIVNVGSVFGAIGFPFFATYSATKFALRGFSQALRRELDGTGVAVTYVAPRATRTPMGDDTEAMAAEVGMNIDEPADVAVQIADAIEARASERTLGFPEKLFARINGVLPGAVDGSLRKQAAQMRPFAERAVARRATFTENTTPRAVEGVAR